MSNRIIITTNNNEVQMTIINQQSNKALVLYRNNHYVVSDNGRETLIFPSDNRGNIISYQEVGGGRSVTITEVLGDFSSFFYTF